MKNIEAIRAKYEKIAEGIKPLPEEERHAAYRHLCLTDTYFLLRYGINVGDGIMETVYAYNQCQFADDIEFNRGGLHNWIFLWFREGMKTTVLNIGKNIQHILKDQNSSTLILSNTNPGAKMFLFDIKQILESSANLKAWFPDVLYENPEKESPKWNLEALVVKRKHARKEPTLFCSGLVDGSMEKVHCEYLCYDDAVTETSVETQHMMEKTEKAMRLSFALGKNIDVPGKNPGAMWFVGTRYSDGDAYGKLIDEGIYKTSLIPWHTGDSVTPRAHTPQKIEELRKQMSYYNFSTQYELNPVPAQDRKFRAEIKYYDGQPHEGWDYILLCDPAGEGKKKREHNTDYTAMAVIGRDINGNEFFVDGVYDRIPLLDRIRKMFGFVCKYKIKQVWYEKVGMQADFEIIKSKMQEQGVHFRLNEFVPNAHGPKQNRIESALMHRVDNGILRFPYSKRYINTENEVVDLTGVIRNEMARFPRGSHDDMIDCLAQLSAVPQYGSPHQAPEKEFDSSLDREPRSRKKVTTEAQTKLYI